MENAIRDPVPDPPDAVVELDRVTHNFGSHRTLDEVTIRVAPGDLYGFLGLNGAGKSTTIRVLLGLIRLQRGQIRLFGSPIAGERLELYRQVGFLMETYSPYPYLSARDNLKLHARLLGLSRQDTRRRSKAVLERVHLKDVADKKTRKFSLGMRRRLGVATALLGAPRLLILDEPTNGLDPQGIHDLREILLDVHAQGVTVFLSSHLLGEVEQLCTRVGIIHEGRMLHDGAVDDITSAERGLFLVRARPAERAVEILGAASWCRRVERSRSESGDGDREAILVELEPDDIGRLAPALVEAAVEIRELRPRERTLETFFREVIGTVGGERGPDDLGTERRRVDGGDVVA